MDLLLTAIEKSLAPLLARSSWSLHPVVGADRVRLVVSSEGTSFLEVALEPRFRPREGGAFAITEHFYLYYSRPHGTPPRPLDDAAIGALMDTVLAQLRAHEPRLESDALRRWFETARSAVAAERARDEHDRSLSVLEFGGEAAHEHILRVTFACNQRCPFCFVSLGASRPDLGQIERALDEIRVRARGDAVITISGGEPTLDKRLEAITAACRRRGFATIQLQTNAVRLAQPAVAAMVRRAGFDGCFVSFHSHRAALYDRLTGSRGDFPKAVAGIRALLDETEATVTLNAVVTRLNVASLEAYVRFVDRLRPRGRPLGIFFSMMSGLGHRLAPELAVPLDTVRPHIQRAVARAEACGLEVAEFRGECALPPCLLARPERNLDVHPEPDHGVIYADRVAPDAAGGRVKRTTCRECRLDRRCGGVSLEYAAQWGLAALRPRPPLRGPRPRPVPRSRPAQRRPPPPPRT
jgi:pyruvate-formate lyase-activating enzyme